MYNNLLLPNWADGMKVNARHFSEMQAALLHHSYQAGAFFIGYNGYGLLNADNLGKNNLHIELNGNIIDNVVVKLWECYAVTPSGIPIVYSSQDNNSTPLTGQFNASQRATYLYVVLTADPENRMPVGELDANTIPHRHPYTTVAHKIAILPQDQINLANVNSNHLIVARLKLADTCYEEDKTYIPPCATINAYRPLAEQFLRGKKYVNDILDASIKITQKVVEKGQRHSLAENMKNLCEHLAYHIARMRFELDSTYLYSQPHKALTLFTGLAGICRVFVHTLTDRDREEFLNYVGEWSGYGSGNTDIVIANAFRLEYQHNLINDSWQPSIQFLEMMSDTLMQIAKLDLVGQPKGGEEWLVMQTANPTRPAQQPVQQQPQYAPQQQPAYAAPQPAYAQQPPAPAYSTAPNFSPKPITFPNMPSPQQAPPNYPPQPQSAPQQPAQPEPPKKKGWGLL